MKQTDKFPVKKALINTVILTVVFALSLALLNNIDRNVNEGDSYWLLLVIWGACYGLSLIVYWLYVVIKYKKQKKQKNEKK